MFTNFDKVIFTLGDIASETNEVGFWATDEHHIEVKYNPNCEDTDREIICSMLVMFDEFDPENDGENFLYEDIEIHIAPFEE